MAQPVAAPTLVDIRRGIEMAPNDAAPKGVITLQTVLRMCVWAAVVGLVFGLYLGTQALQAS
jgi:hypothetical protein